LWNQLLIMSKDNNGDENLSGMLAELLRREGLQPVSLRGHHQVPRLRATPPDSASHKNLSGANPAAVPGIAVDQLAPPALMKELARELGLPSATLSDANDRAGSLAEPVTRDPQRQRVESRHRIHRNSPCGRVLGREPVDVRYEVVEVPLSQITTGAIRNSRQDDTEEEFAMLLASIERRGILHPVLVVDDPQQEGKFVLIAGFRRFRAACELGLSTLLVKVYPIHFIAEAYMINLAENFARKEIGPYALACQCRHLQEMRIPITKIAEEIGRTTGYLYAIMRYLDLPEAIVADWKNGHALLTLPRLQKLAAMPPKEATSRWLKVRARHLREESPSTKDPLKELVNEEVDPDDAEALAALRPYRRPSQAALQKYRAAIAQMEMPKEPETCRQICLDTVDLACGVITEVRHVPYRPRRCSRKSRG